MSSLRGYSFFQLNTQIVALGITLGSLLQRNEALTKDASFLRATRHLVSNLKTKYDTDLGVMCTLLATYIIDLKIWQQEQVTPSHLEKVSYASYYEDYRKLFKSFKEQTKARKYNNNTLNFDSGKFHNSRFLLAA